MTVKMTYGPLDYSFSDDYYIFRAFVYPDDLGGDYISEDYGANVVPEFSWPFMILSITLLFGILVGRIKPYSRKTGTTDYVSTVVT